MEQVDVVEEELAVEQRDSDMVDIWTCESVSGKVGKEQGWPWG